jgi:hypothetical protein
VGAVTNLLSAAGQNIHFFDTNFTGRIPFDETLININSRILHTAGSPEFIVGETGEYRIYYQVQVYSAPELIGTPIDLYAELDSVEGNTTTVLDTAHFTINRRSLAQRTITVTLNAGAVVSLRMYDPRFPNPSPIGSPDISADGQSINFVQISPPIRTLLENAESE